MPGGGTRVARVWVVWVMGHPSVLVCADFFVDEVGSECDGGADPSPAAVITWADAGDARPAGRVVPDESTVLEVAAECVDRAASRGSSFRPDEDRGDLTP